jgi:hypothetical protein
MIRNITGLKNGEFKKWKNNSSFIIPIVTYMFFLCDPEYNYITLQNMSFHNQNTFLDVRYSISFKYRARIWLNDIKSP